MWHLPLFFMPETWHGQMGFRLAGFWLFLLFQIALSMIMTWVYWNTDRSILSGIFLHFTSNFTAQLLWPYSDRVEALYSILVLAAGAAVCLRLQRKGNPVQFSAAGIQVDGRGTNAGLSPLPR